MFGQRFRLRAATIATAVSEGKGMAFQIPAGAEILVIDTIRVDPEDSNRQVKVEWEGKPVTMFVIDIRERGDRS